MPRNPFAELNSGDRLPGIPHEAWNGFLRGLKTKGQPAAGGFREGPVEINVRNTTQNPIQRCGVLQVASPTITYALDQEQFFARDLMEGTTPAAASPFVITLRPLSVGEIGPARLLGLTRCKVNMTSTSHRYADATTDTTRLTSAASGPARILWNEDNFAATGEKWSVVELLGTSSAAGVSLVGTTSGSLSVTVGTSPTQNLFTGVGSGLYQLVSTLNLSTPLGPASQQQYVQTTYGSGTPTPSIFEAEIIASTGLWTSYRTVVAVYSFGGSSNTVSFVANSGNSTIQTITYAWVAALLKLA